jgi:predicted TIM-barrel fold metal-dependent hydrolase
MPRRSIRLAMLAASLAVISSTPSAPLDAAQAAGPSPTHAAAVVLPFTDVHAHLEASDPQRSIDAALQAMTVEHAARIIFLPPPFSPDDPGRYDAELFGAQVKAHADKLAAVGGGGSLNVMIQEAVRTGKAGPEVQRRFRERAEELLREGVVGFGEMTAEHLAGATAYQSAPPDHPLFFLLADIAAEHGVPIDLHMEAIPQTTPLPADFRSPPNAPQLRANIAAFERLLAHNPRAKIMWAHAGCDVIGYRTPALSRQLLRNHPNLYMEIKIDPQKVGRNSPLAFGASGGIKPEWLKLFEDFPDRFLVGTDQHYPEPHTGVQRWQPVAHLLQQLPPGLRQKIGTENAQRLYPATPAAGASR